MQILEGETSNGRHRRPESLADPTVLRPPATPRIAGGRRTSLDLTPRRAKVDKPARATRSGAAGSAPRGRHAKAGDPLAITVRPLPVVRDAAGAVRDWALADNGRPPVTGSHRAPGTLPIESWLLVGRRRQQALLASLVAIGLMLIVVPMQQRATTDVNPINAADHAIVQVTKPAKKKEKPAEPQAKTPGKTDTPAEPAATAPAKPVAPGAPKPSASAPVEKPTVVVPEGTGPAKSFITTGSSTVALTFDDGPDPVQTPKILELLAKYQVKATFCLVGSQVRRHPDIVRQIAAAGHTLCNHTWDHSLTIGKDKPAKIQADLRKTNEAIDAAVPGAAIPFFRAPGGNFSDALVETAYADGMTSLYWEVDPRDWEHLDTETDATHIEKIVKGVQKHVRPGSIVLSHDFNQPDTIAAYDELLPWLIDRFELGLPPEPKPPVADAPASAGL
ncbi:polysaccharide deacetylase [Actinoplanes friuliensis DSM 7358]|uniref:Polysaccharide deacetylase n=1 Tax=Actinoplanes friuliensis DSM 7358 TaxID=1246995 RepID=U5W9J7_9ACTN|nr:polysaccharide deacetylase [Actinoplanes friuliensis DSM 7358]